MASSTVSRMLFPSKPMAHIFSKQKHVSVLSPAKQQHAPTVILSSTEFKILKLDLYKNIFCKICKVKIFQQPMFFLYEIISYQESETHDEYEWRGKGVAMSCRGAV